MPFELPLGLSKFRANGSYFYVAQWSKLALACTAVAALCACALPRMIDSEVESFGGTPGAPTAVSPATYRFERLPSQQAKGAARTQVEAMVEVALQSVALERDDAHPRYTVQAEVRVSTINNPYPRPQHRRGPQVTADGRVYYPQPSLFLESPWYRHTARLILRDAATDQVVYETSATFDGPWSDTANLLPAILKAALSDYPNPPTGVRKVVIELPHKAREGSEGSEEGEAKP